MCAALGPAHLLFFHKALADHVVYRRFDECRGDRLVVPVAVAVVRNERLVGLDIAAELLYRERAIPGAGVPMPPPLAPLARPISLQETSARRFSADRRSGPARGLVLSH